jgi:non-ribosomal peptide synthetase component F
MFDLNLQIYEEDGDLREEWQYATDLFDAATVGAFRETFVRIVDRIVADPDVALADLACVAGLVTAAPAALPSLAFDF